MQPRPSSRIKSLETRATTIEAKIEELADDQAESNKALLQRMNEGFDQAHTFVQERFTEISSRFDQVEGRLDRIETALKDHGSLLQQILNRLPPIGE